MDLYPILKHFAPFPQEDIDNPNSVILSQHQKCRALAERKRKLDIKELITKGKKAYRKSAWEAPPAPFGNPSGQTQDLSKCIDPFPVPIKLTVLPPIIEGQGKPCAKCGKECLAGGMLGPVKCDGCAQFWHIRCAIRWHFNFRTPKSDHWHENSLFLCQNHQNAENDTRNAAFLTKASLYSILMGLPKVHPKVGSF